MTLLLNEYIVVSFHVVVVEPAIGEYHELSTKYEIEKGCRTEAENFATQVGKGVLIKYIAKGRMIWKKEKIEVSD